MVLAIGLAAACVGGLAVFLNAAGAAGSGIPVVPVATVVVLVVGVALARWSVAPVRRRYRARTVRAAAVPAVPAGPPGPGDLGDLLVAPQPAPEVPAVAEQALDHAGADPDGFEHTVAALCARDGCSPVEVVGGAGDLGADVIATTAGGLRVVVQCKHYCDGNRVGSQDLQRFGGTCFAVHEADIAVVVTTSSFTAPAEEYAATCGIICIDGEALAAWTELAAPPPWEASGRDHASRMSTA
ncbi:hypothetical protein AMK16_21965 [Streptomyces sp. CB00455]|nr:hypothetical protein AMK16_21965 [Streptomyces sp. CB00455]